jgi:oxaloacetate decarboxylase alpha subunit
VRDPADNKVRFVDTTIRDGQQSLWATNMRTGMMLPVLPILDRAGFESIEIHANSFEKKMVRELKEDPFERLRRARELVTNTPLRIIRGRYLTSFQIAPRALEELWYNLMGSYGIDEVRTSDSSNTAVRWRDNVEMARASGVKTVLNLVFSISPRHTDEYYALKAREAAAIRPYRICLKDPGALLTPERLVTLVPAILAHTGDIPVEFHTHCNTGLGGLCTLKAIELGIRSVNTAIPPMAEGSSNPSTLDVVRNARVLGYETMLDESELPQVEAHLRAVAEAEGFPVGKPLPYDAAHYIHQVPGGMISNLRFQLHNAGLGDKLAVVLEEIGRVRADFGYPIMVTPYSQFIGAQAVMNVIAGERYKTVSDEIIHYALGNWGEDERDSIDPTIRDKVLDRPRARELERGKAEEPTLADLRRRFGGSGISDEEMMMRLFTDRETVNAMKQAGPARPWTGKSGIIELIEKLAGKSRLGLVQIDSAEMKLRLGGQASAQHNERPIEGQYMGKLDTLSDAEIANIGKLVEVLDRSAFDFLTLEQSGFRLTVGKGAVAAAPVAAGPAPTAAAASAPAPQVNAATTAAVPGAEPAAMPGTVEVKATTMGRFYSRPEPAADPFVAVGTEVNEDSTVGLIEVMKLFNSMSAGVSGEVAEICVQDGDLVEYGQVLMRIRPAT